MQTHPFDQFARQNQYFGWQIATWKKLQITPVTSATQTAQLTLVGWVPLDKLNQLQTTATQAGWQLQWKPNSITTNELTVAQTWVITAFNLRKAQQTCPVQVQTVTLQTWTLVSDDQTFPLTAFGNYVNRLLKQYGYPIQIQTTTTRSTRTNNWADQIRHDQQRYQKLFTNFQTNHKPSNQPVVQLSPRAKNRVLQGKIITLFLQKYSKKPQYFLTLENQEGVYNLVVLKSLLTLNQVSQFHLGSWWRFECHWDPKQNKHQITTAQEIAPLITRFDGALQKRIEFHVHTKMSALDGVGDLEDYLVYANAWKHPAIAITDHENVHSFAEAQLLQAKFPKLKIIYGCEFNYVVDDHFPLVLNPQPNAQLLKNQELVFFDLETTGLVPEQHHIIQFAAVVLKNGLILEKVSFFVQTSQTISTNIWKLTNIDQQKYHSTAIPIQEAFQQIQKVFANRILVAHNAQFDTAFLRVLYRNFGTSFGNSTIDSLRLSHLVNPDFPRHTLAILARKLKIATSKKHFHSAVYDARILAMVFESLLERSNFTTLDQLTAKNRDRTLLERGFPYHVNLLVKNQTGLKHLYQLVSLSHTKTLFQQRPVLLASQLALYRQHFLVGAACYNSEVFQMALNGTTAQLTEAIRKYDYIEIQPPEVYAHLCQQEKLTEAELHVLLKRIIAVATEAKVLIIASGDVHYVNPEDRIYRDVLVSNKMLRGSRHPLYNKSTKPTRTPLQYLRTTNEMKAALHFLGDDKLIHRLVVTNCHKLNAQIANVKCFNRPRTLPEIPNVNQMLTDLARTKLKAKFGHRIDLQVQKRFDQELTTIIDAGFATIYLIAYKLTNYSLENGFLFSSRGSVGSSFLAYCLDISEVNPLPPYYACKRCHYFQWSRTTNQIGFDLPVQTCPNCQIPLIGDGNNIIFESFLGLKVDVKPDIDLNFSSWFQEKAQSYVTEYLTNYFGKQHVFRAGTISTLANRSAYNLYRNYIETEHDNQDKALPFGQKEQIIYYCTGIKRTTGQHPGGLMIIPKNREIYDYCPYNYPSNNRNVGILTTHFDYHVLNDHLLKIDILGHDDPTGLRILQQLTNQNPGAIPFNDRQVVRLFSDISVLGIQPKAVLNETTGALGLPEYGTPFVRKILQKVQVKTFAGLIAVSGLSHGTNVWENNAKTLMLEHNFALEDVIACRDDILLFLINQGMTKLAAFAIMNKIKYGKGLNVTDEKLLKQHRVPDWYVDSCKKIGYLFPRAHATAYAIMAYRFAWFKLHHPHQFYAMYFTIRCAVFDLKTIISGPQTVLAKYQKLQKTLKANYKGSKTAALSNQERALIPILEVVLEMYARQIKMIDLNLEHSDAMQFRVISHQGVPVIVPPFNAVNGLGGEVAQRIVKVRQEKPFTDQADFKKRTKINQTLFQYLQRTGFFANLRQDKQANFTFTG